MSAFPGTEAGSWAPIIKAAHRLVPSYEMEVDLVAVSKVASCSTRADWESGTLTGVFANERGEVQLNAGESGLVLLDTTTGSPTVALQGFLDDGDRPQELSIDVFVDPATVGGQPVTIGTITLRLRRDAAGFPFLGSWRVSIDTYDDQWRRVPLGDPFVIDPSVAGFPGGDVTIDLLADYGRAIVLDPAQLRTRTGPGLNAAGVRRDVDVVDGRSQLTAFRAFSIAIYPDGPDTGRFGAAWGVVTSQPIFEPTTFWRGLGNSAGVPKRNHGPYFPQSPPLDPSTPRMLDGAGVTGAVPGYGARSCPAGSWGIARRVESEGRAQSAAPWYQPYCRVTARTVVPSGTAVVVLDMGDVPTTEVQFRADDWVRRGTAITYSLRGRNATGDAWTAIGAVVDGATIPALFRYYEVTATFTATVVAGGNALVSPLLQAVQITERVRYRTEGLTGAIDADATVDPVTGQSSIGELALTLQRGPRDDFRDLATQLAAGVSPSRLEAQVYGVCTTTGARRFLESYRMESRTPFRDREEYRFVSGLDRLQVRIPPQVETYTLPAAGAAAPTIATVTGSGSSRTLTLSGPGATWATGALTGFRMRLRTGTLAGTDVTITSATAPSTLVIALPPSGLVPAIGDAVEIHSDIFRRQDVVYTAQDPALVYEDVLTARARVPRRVLGTLPETGRITDPAGTVLTTSGRLKATGGSDDGVTALSVLQALASLLGGAVVWRRGLISFVDLFSPRDSAAVWDERDYETLESPTGLDRRMPSVSCKFGADPSSDAFAGEVVANDLSVIAAAGRSNLFDVTAVDDAIAKWCTSQALATAHVSRLRDAFAAGVPVWTVSLVQQWPWIDLGDVVTIMTDQFTNRVYRFSPDGLTDESTPIFGRTATVGVVIGRNLAADRFVVLARRTTPASDGSTGGGPTDSPVTSIPVPAITLAAVTGGVRITSTPPTSAYFNRLEYDVRTRTTAGPGAWSTVTRIVGSREGDDFLSLIPDVDTDVEVTPVTISTGNTATAGTAVTIALLAFGGGTMGARFTGCTVGAPAPGAGPSDLTVSWTVADAPTGATYSMQVLFDGSTQTLSPVSSGVVLRTGTYGSSGVGHTNLFTTGGLLSMISASGAVLAQQLIPAVSYYSGDLT
jgi:hypothetical protein